jgi:hypothetical protein
MMNDPDAVRRWTRVLSGLRSRSLKVRRQDSAADAVLNEILAESLDACDALLQDLAGAHLACDELRHEVKAEAWNRQYLMDRMPVACVSTDDGSLIHNANQPAADLFNISAKHLRGRLLLHFSVDRPAFGRLLQTLPTPGSHLEAFVPVRPRERGLFQMNALIVPETTAGPPSWLWFLKPASTDTHAPG